MQVKDTLAAGANTLYFVGYFLQEQKKVRWRSSMPGKRYKVYRIYGFSIEDTSG